MKILIDIGHPAHVHYFKNFIKIMKSNGHEFLITARDKEITHELLNFYNISYISRGKGKSNLFGKIIYAFKADHAIYKLSKKWKPDVFLSFGSPYAAHVSKILGKPHIALTDTEHAFLGLLAFVPFSKAVLTPDCFKKDLGKKQIHFRSYIEYSYLHSNYFVADVSVKESMGISQQQKFVLFRFVSWGASHDIGQSGIPDETKKELITIFEENNYKVFISSEGLLSSAFEAYRIKVLPEKMHDVIKAADFFIGESGTMATEAAILGTPSVFVSSLNAGVFEDEVKNGILYSFRSTNGLMDKVKTLLADNELKEKHLLRKNFVADKKINITEFLVWFVENYPESFKIAKNNPALQDRFLNSSMTIEKLQNENICTRCILDTTVKDIWFDEAGECKYCKIHNELEIAHPVGPQMDAALKNSLEKIKKSGKNKKYDCIVGVSGGRDSTYTLLMAKKMGLRPLAVHFDNGWNSDISVKNIKKACTKLNVELVTVVADWQEFKDLQVAFLRSSTPDADIPTDYAIYSVLYSVANAEGLKYILNGHSFRTEGTSPISWTYMDPLYVKDVHQKHGILKKITSFPHMSLFKLQYFIWVKGIRDFRLMEYIDYNKKKVDEILKSELDWEYYGGHHHENHYTKFFQSYYLPVKFNIDKRKTELSALVRSGQITRIEALQEIQAGAYKYEQESIDYVINKLNISTGEWKKIMLMPVRSHNDYKTLLPLIRLLRWPIKIATKFKVLPQILYLKYAK